MVIARKQEIKPRRQVWQEFTEGWRYVAGFVPIRSILSVARRW